MSHFTVDIYTPDKIVAKGVPADSVHIPTTRGLINILPNHTHLITKLDTGLLTCATGSQENQFVMTTGIVKVLGKQITVLAQVAEDAKYVDTARAEKALKLAKQKLSGNETLSDDDLEKYRRKLSRAFLRTSIKK